MSSNNYKKFVNLESIKIDKQPIASIEAVSSFKICLKLNVNTRLLSDGPWSLSIAIRDVRISLSQMVGDVLTAKALAFKNRPIDA